MDETSYKYKSNQRISKIPSSIIDLQYLKKLFEILKNTNDEAVQIVLRDIDEKYKQFPLLYQRINYQDLKRNVLESYKIHIQISGTRGEYIASDSSSIFSEEYLPDYVTSIKLDNSFFHEIIFNTKPRFQLEVVFDFRKPPLFDFISSPSYPTPNDSTIQVFGENETWVEGSHEKIISSMSGRQTRRSWLHQRNIYDLLLLFFLIPISFWNLRKFDLFISSYLSQHSVILKVAIYSYVFLIMLCIFRFVFNYLRWIFPYIELKTSIKNRNIFHRLLFLGILSAITYSLIRDAFLCLIKHMF